MLGKYATLFSAIVAMVTGASIADGKAKVVSDYEKAVENHYKQIVERLDERLANFADVKTSVATSFDAALDTTSSITSELWINASKIAEALEIHGEEREQALENECRTPFVRRLKTLIASYDANWCYPSVQYANIFKEFETVKFVLSDVHQIVGNCTRGGRLAGEGAHAHHLLAACVEEKMQEDVEALEGFESDILFYMDVATADTVFCLEEHEEEVRRGAYDVAFEHLKCARALAE